MAEPASPRTDVTFLHGGDVASDNDQELPDECVESMLAYADDELISSHTLAHLCDLAGPGMEPMLAILSYVQDDTGHSLLWYSAVASHLGRSPDELVFERAPEEFRSAALVETEPTDWPIIVAKNYLYKSADVARQEAIIEHCPVETIRGLVSRTVDEDRFHVEFWGSWAAQLRVWPETNERFRNAVHALASDVGALFDLPGLWAPPVQNTLAGLWAERAAAELEMDEDELLAAVGPVSRGTHADGFGKLIDSMQVVYRSFPEGRW